MAGNKNGYSFNTLVGLAKVGDSVMTSTKPGNQALGEIITATVYVHENYRVAIRYSHESYLSSDTTTGDEMKCKALLTEKGFSLNNGWIAGDSPLTALYTPDVEQSRMYGRIMGVLYGYIRGHEMENDTIIYSQLSYDVCRTAHCTHQQLIDTCKELIRYSDVVKKYLEAKNEM
jgi:hypothetical protein